MEISPDQIEKVKLWLADGAGVGELQRLIESEFGIHATYMDVRFLIDDIGAEIIEKQPPQVAEAKNSYKDTGNQETLPSAAAENVGEQGSGEMTSLPPDSDKVKVSVSPIQRPGTLASGDVVFSDGVKCEWIFDQTGQLALLPSDKNYRPPESDIADFQTKLQQELKKLF